MIYIVRLHLSLRPVASIKVAIPDGLGDVHGLDLFAAGEVGDGAGYFEDAAVGTGGELQAFHGHAEHVETGGVGLGELVEHALGHHGVAVDAAPPPALPCREGAEALGLDVAGLDDTLANYGTRLARLHYGELAEGHRRDFDMDVDAVEDFIHQ